MELNDTLQSKTPAYILHIIQYENDFLRLVFLFYDYRENVLTIEIIWTLHESIRQFCQVNTRALGMVRVFIYTRVHGVYTKTDKA